MIPYYQQSGEPSRVLGFPMNQNRAAVPTWSYAMEVLPPKRIVELGAYNGGFTTAIGVHAYRIGCEVHSFDLAKCPNEEWQALSDFLGIKFYTADMFEPETVAQIIGLIQSPGITYLLCDGGNKAKEVNFFAPYLKPGDIIGAHDYCSDSRIWCGGEIIYSQVADTVNFCGLQPFLQADFDLAAWLVFKRG